MEAVKRRCFPKNVETQVLLTSRRRCALCFGLDGDTTEKEGQVAHVDRNPSNVELANAAWLCTKHHARYDSRSRQTKGHTLEELRAYQGMLAEYLVSPAAWPDAGTNRTQGPGVSLEVFDRRVPTYRVTIEFLRTVSKGTRIELQELFKFATETDEVLFLFDDHIAAYLAELFKRALRYRAVNIMIEPPDRRTPELTEEEAQHLLWFSEQFEVVRSKFAPYLRIGTLANKALQPTAASATVRRRG
jgi:hypothetical protein